MKTFKECTKERLELFELQKEFKGILQSPNVRLLEAIIELRVLKNKLEHLISKLEQQENRFDLLEHKHGFPCGICGATNFDEAGDKCRGVGDCPGENMSREVFEEHQIHG